MPTSSCQKCDPKPTKVCLIKNRLLIVSMVGIYLGITLGFGLRPASLSESTIMWIGIWGELFLCMLKMIIIPLVIACLVTGVGALEDKASGRLGIANLVYIIVTQVFGVIIGIILAVSIRPGTNLGDEPPFGTASSTEYGDTFADMLRNLSPENVVQACLQHVGTEVSSNTSKKNAVFFTNLTIPSKLVIYKDGTNLLVFSLVFDWGVHAAGEVGKPVYNFFVGISVVIFKMLTLIFWYAPLGVASLKAASILRIEDISAAFQSLGLLILSVVVGNLFHMLVVLPLCARTPTSTHTGQ